MPNIQCNFQYAKEIPNIQCNFQYATEIPNIQCNFQYATDYRFRLLADEQRTPSLYLERNIFQISNYKHHSLIGDILQLYNICQATVSDNIPSLEARYQNHAIFLIKMFHYYYWVGA